ncbi:MAG: efflux RND transporter periplasmic adaptor subunit [Minisyncoccota bacterium]
MITKIKNYIQTHKKIVVTIGLLLIVILYFIFRSGNGSVETFVVEKGTISEQVIVTGKVKPANEVDLAFDRSGKVSRAFVEIGSSVVVGQTLVTLDSSEVYADYLKAQANVASEQARLDELNRGTRPEELSITESEVSNSEIAVSNAEDKLQSALYEAYTKSDDAVRNNVDQLFSNPKTSNPQITITINDTQLKNDINIMRFEVENLLSSWDKNTTSTSRETIVKISNDLNTVKMFVDKVASAVNALSSNSSVSASTVDGYKSSISSARNILISAQTSISTAEEKLNSTKSSLLIAQKNLSLKKVGTSEEEIRAQQARVLQYQAQVQAVGAQLSKMTLRSPLTGVVTKQDAKTGEIVSSGKSVVSIISNNDLEIEANVSEISVGKVQLGNHVDITMDAFPGKIFSGNVTYIEPGETIVDGVVNFKITVAFNEKYSELKTGLSTNMTIVTAQKEGVLRIPAYAVTKKDDISYVSIREGNNTPVEVRVNTGFKGSDGFVEILSGLKEGDVLVLSGENK